MTMAMQPIHHPHPHTVCRAARTVSCRCPPGRWDSSPPDGCCPRVPRWSSCSSTRTCRIGPTLFWLHPETDAPWNRYLHPKHEPSVGEIFQHIPALWSIWVRQPPKRRLWEPQVAFPSGGDWSVFQTQPFARKGEGTGLMFANQRKPIANCRTVRMPWIQPTDAVRDSSILSAIFSIIDTTFANRGCQ